ncbi:MAG: DUF971 domain-containing protein [Burkholderiales bacterium]
MAGLKPGDPRPTEIRLLQKSRVLEISFDDAREFRFPFEFLRVYSPSAEVRGHSAGQEVLQTGKRDVEVIELEPVGNYAIRPRFSDGHDTGLYSWDYLYELGKNQDDLWRRYLEKMQKAGATRDAGGENVPVTDAVKPGWKKI